jgi:hypothetical protein
VDDIHRHHLESGDCLKLKVISSSEFDSVDRRFLAVIEKGNNCDSRKFGKWIVDSLFHITPGKSRATSRQVHPDH